MTRLARKLRRALFLIPYVAAHNEGVAVADLAAMLGCPPGELAREIESLFLVGLPGGGPDDLFDIAIEGTGARAKVFATASRLLRRPPRLTAAECLALLLGASALTPTGITPFDEALDRATRKIRDLVGADQRGAPAVAPLVIAQPPQGGGPFLEVLSRAARAQRTVELDYCSISSQQRRKLIFEPFGLMNHGGAWYLLGRSVTHGEERIFPLRVERILGAAMLQRRFSVPKDFKLDNFRSDRMFIPGVKAVPIRLRFRGTAARRLAQDFKHARPQPDGSLVVDFKDAITGYLAAWVLRQGADVEVLAPHELSARVRALALRVAEAHAQGVDDRTPRLDSSAA